MPSRESPSLMRSGTMLDARAPTAGPATAPHPPTAQPLVLHSVETWLPQTLTWLHAQVADTQSLGMNAHVACQSLQNIDQFGVPHLHPAQATRPPGPLAASARLGWLKTLGERGYAIASQCWHSPVGDVFDRHIGALRTRPQARHLLSVGRRLQPDIVHSHFGHIGWGDLAAVRALGARHVVTFYGLDVNKLPRSPVWRRRYLDLFAQVDRVLCEGTHMAACLMALGCPERKVKVHHLGVDVEGIPFEPRRWQPGETLKVLIAASFREKKGIPYAIDALGRVAREVPLELTVIGDAGSERESQDQKRRILQALARSGLHERTRLLGFQPHARMLAEARAHHVFMQPSVTARDGDTEGGAPVCITEMLASGMPVIATQHCDIPEVMGASLKHLLAPERDAPALADRLRGLLSQPASWESIADAGRARVEAEYRRDRQALRLREHYLTLIHSR
jgi:colanic acid/amylovoran biosynthesis glycosyltransferase